MLGAIRLLHTIIWALMVACILALPIVAVRGRFAWALAISLLILIETVVLLLNRWRCPLTDLAARYTDDRADNFDIYLPRWLARHNKVLFGALWLSGEGVFLWRWLRL